MKNKILIILTVIGLITVPPASAQTMGQTLGEKIRDYSERFKARYDDYLKALAQLQATMRDCKQNRLHMKQAQEDGKVKKQMIKEQIAQGKLKLKQEQATIKVNMQKARIDQDLLQRRLKDQQNALKNFR